MNSGTKRPFLIIVLSVLINCSSFQADAGGLEPDPMQQVIAEIRHAVKENNFSVLTRYGSKSELLYWGVCNSEGSVKFSIDEMVKQLSKDSRNTRISVNEKSDGGLIETVGWPGESTYLYFQFTKEGNRWKWLGVCESRTRSIDFEPEKK